MAYDGDLAADIEHAISCCRVWFFLSRCGRGIEAVVEAGDVVHRAVQELGLSRVRCAQGDPRIGQQVAGITRVPGLADFAASVDECAGQRVNDFGVLSGHG